MKTHNTFSRSSDKESLRGRLQEARAQFLAAGGVEEQVPSHVFGEDFATPKPLSAALRKLNTAAAEDARLRKIRSGQ